MVEYAHNTFLTLRGEEYNVRQTIYILQTFFYEIMTYPKLK